MKKERSPHNYKKTRIDIICDILVKFVLPCIVIGIMLLITFTSHASSEESITYELPYNFYVFDANNTLCLEYNEDIIQSGKNWNSDIASYNWDNYIAFPLEVSWNSYGEVQIRYLFNPRIEYDVPSDINYFNTGITITYDNTVTFDVLFDSPITPFEFSSWGSGGSGSTNLCGGFLPYDTGKGSIQRFYPFYSSNDIYDTNGDLIFGYITNPVINYGHATPPDEFNSPVYTQGHVKPEHVPPTVTVNNYSWTTYTPPTVDNSTLEKLLESLTDIVKYNATYLKDNLHNEFTNLINNIKNLIDFIGQTIQYYGDLIIENIQNLITTFYNNMLSLFEPISTFIDYISQPLDMESLTETVNSTQIMGDVDTCTTFANDAFGIYGTVAEPNTFKIPLDLRSISLLNVTQVYYIDLSWLDGAKTAIRAFMWCIVTFGLLYSIIVDIPNMIRSSK